MRISDWSSDVCSSDLDVTIEDIQFTIGFHAYDTVAFANLMAVPNDDTVVVVCADRNWRVRIYGGLKASVQCVHPNLCVFPGGEEVGLVLRRAGEFRELVRDHSRSAERRVGQEWVRMGRSRWWPAY